MNPVLNHMCQRFGAQDCANASLIEIMAMLFTATLVGLVTTWVFGKLAIRE